jgi:Rieske 2Fe-2S family protein
VAGFTKARLGEASKTLAGEYYRSAAVFEREQEGMFARNWIYAGRAEHVAGAGDFVLRAVAGEELILVRGRDGAVRAFYNLCRHRGTRLCAESTGRFTGSIVCPYHAWSYGFDGALLVARHMDDSPGFDRNEYPLHEAAVHEWNGFLFVSLAAEPEPFARALPGLDARFDPWRLGDLRTVETIEYDVACNWKLVFQNYSECYHCPVIHPQLEALSAWDSGRNDLHEGPVLGGYSTLRAGATSLTAGGTSSRPPIADLAPEERERAYYYTIFPSLMLSLHADYAMIHDVRPLAVDRTHVACSWLFEPATIAMPGFDASDAVMFWDRTNRQDWAIGERTQLGIASRAYEPGPYAASEGLLAAFDRHYLGQIRV